MNVFGLPGGTLMQFEGSGIETVWQFVLPAAANPGGLGTLADAMVTFDLRAQFSPARFAAATGAPLAAMSKTLLISAARTVPVELLAVRDKAKTSAAIHFDLSALALPPAEKTRTVGNLFLVLVGAVWEPGLGASATCCRNRWTDRHGTGRILQAALGAHRQGQGNNRHGAQDRCSVLQRCTSRDGVH